MGYGQGAQTNMAKRGIKYESKIADFRQAKHLTQRQLADRIDVSEGTIANWEGARRGFDCLVTVSRLCQVLEVAPHQLYEEIDEAAQAVAKGIEELEATEQERMADLALDVEYMKSVLADLLRPSGSLRLWDIIAPLASCRPAVASEKGGQENGDEAQQLFEFAQKLVVSINKAYEDIVSSEEAE